jgi:EmrB/QacA subfamily drug resistance transporter
MSTTEVTAPPERHVDAGTHVDPHYERRWLILLVVSLAQLMILVDATIINVALPSAQRALHFSAANREWVITAYVLAFGSLLPLGGRFADLFGRKAMFVTGAVGFGAMSALAGASPNFTTLLLARALQGVSAAILAPAALSVIPVTFTDTSERNRAFAVFGAVAGSSGALGLLLGGILTSYESWRWTMYVNDVFAVLAIFGALSLMTNERNPLKPRLDIIGTLLASGGLFLVVFGSAKAELDGWTANIALASLTAGGFFLISFLVSQKYIKNPLIPLSVILDRNRGASYLALAFANIGIFAVLLFLTYYFQKGIGFSPVRTGFAFLPLPLAIVVVASITQEKLLKMFTMRSIVMVGLATSGLGALVLTRTGVAGDYWSIDFPGLALLGAGIGSALIVAVAMGSSGTAPEDAGTASAMSTVSQQIGAAVGIAVLSTFAATATTHFFHSHSTVHRALAHATVHGYQTAFWWSAGIFWSASLLCGALVQSKTRMHATDADVIEELAEVVPAL